MSTPPQQFWRWPSPVLRRNRKGIRPAREAPSLRWSPSPRSPCRTVVRLREGALFGALVPWDSVWHPGADSATRVTFNHDVLLEGKALRAGEYTLWLIPREHAPWTVIVSRAAHVFHRPYPGSRFDVLRIEVTPEQASNMESFAIYFPMVLRDSAVMRLHWGTTAVPIRIEAPFKPRS
jgi:hypothetical protein